MAFIVIYIHIYMNGLQILEKYLLDGSASFPDARLFNFHDFLNLQMFDLPTVSLYMIPPETCGRSKNIITELGGDPSQNVKF